MDPHQTLQDMLDLVRVEMWPEAAECARDLLLWAGQGGMLPVPYSRATFIAYLKTIVARAEKLNGLLVNPSNLRV